VIGFGLLDGLTGVSGSATVAKSLPCGICLAGKKEVSPFMRQLSLSRTGKAIALLALLAMTACVDPTISPSASNQPLPKADENVYVASMDAGIAIPALPVEEIPASHRRQVVAYKTDQPVGTIIINPATRLLYYVIGKDKAIRYGIAVGRAGFEWSGEAIVAEKKPWPTWTPPKEMIARDPAKYSKWADGQPGGISNPLGARAIYLTSGGRDYGYRIHGTPEWKSIGRNASSGCIRMINQDVIDLYSRVNGGEKVIVLTASGEMPKGLYIPKPPAPKKVAPVVPTGAVPALKVLPPPAITLPGAVPVVQAVAPVTPVPATAPATTEAPAAAEAVVCATALVNGVCPPATND
jgi:lipoprotein-anchoring transpeptidase ErfK/SrfK